MESLRLLQLLLLGMMLLGARVGLLVLHLLISWLLCDVANGATAGERRSALVVIHRRSDRIALMVVLLEISIVDFLLESLLFFVVSMSSEVTYLKVFITSA